MEEVVEKKKIKVHWFDKFLLIFHSVFLLVGTYYLIEDSLNKIDYYVTISFYIFNIYFIFRIICFYLYSSTRKNFYLINLDGLIILTVYIIFMYLVLGTHYYSNKMIVNIFIIEIFSYIFVIIFAFMFLLFCKRN